MATRLYLTQITSLVSPAANAGWNVTTGSHIYLMIPYHDGSAAVTLTSGAVGAAAVRKCLINQWVSNPLVAQTLNGTLTGQIRYSISSVASTTGQGFVYFRILNNDGTVASEVGTLTTTDLVGAFTNRTLIALTLSAVAITAGQRLCIDMGWNESVGVNTTRTGSVSVRNGAGIDLPVDNTTQAGNNPFIEFSQAILFQNQNLFF